MKRIYMAGLMALLIMLTACSNPTAPIYYYTLNTPELHSSNQQKNQSNPFSASIEIQLLPISLTEYLQQNRLVMQTDVHRLHFSSQHLWAEDLQTAITRALIKDMNNQSRQYHVVSQGRPTLQEAKLKLDVSIKHLIATASGNVKLVGTLLIMNEEALIERQDFTLVRPQSQDGYAHTVQQMRLLITDLAQFIEERIALSTKKQAD